MENHNKNILQSNLKYPDFLIIQIFEWILISHILWLKHFFFKPCDATPVQIEFVLLHKANLYTFWGN